jgi:hypothetical protein
MVSISKRIGQPLVMMAAHGRKEYRHNSCELMQTISPEPYPKSMGWTLYMLVLNTVQIRKH